MWKVVYTDSEGIQRETIFRSKFLAVQFYNNLEGRKRKLFKAHGRADGTLQWDVVSLSKPD